MEENPEINIDIKPPRTITYNYLRYILFCERVTEWQARKVRDDLRSNGYTTRITNMNKKWQVWWAR